MSRSFLRRVALVLSAAALICFCSCERHRAEELERGENAQSGVARHKKADTAGHTKKEEHSDGQSRATTAMSVTPPPASPTPADFFPTPSPH